MLWGKVANFCSWVCHGPWLMICNPFTFEWSYIYCDEVDIWAEVQWNWRWNFVYVWISGIISKWWNHKFAWEGWNIIENMSLTFIWFLQNKISKPYTLEVNDLSGVKSSHLSLLGPATVSFNCRLFQFGSHFSLIKGEKVDGNDGNCLANETTGGLSWIKSHTPRVLLCQPFWSVVVPPLISLINYLATPGSLNNFFATFSLMINYSATTLLVN